MLAQWRIDAKAEILGRDIYDLAGTIGAYEELRDFLKGRNSGGKTDPLHHAHAILEKVGRVDIAPSGGGLNQVLQPFHAQAQVRAAFALCQRMDFVDNHPAGALEVREPIRLREQKRKAFRCGEQNVRRMGEMLLAFARRRVPGTQPDPYWRLCAENFAQRPGQVLFQVIAQGAQRRHINRVDRVLQIAGRVQDGELVQDREKGGQCLPVPVVETIRTFLPRSIFGQATD